MYQVQKNFKGGLDTRNYFLNQPSGTLVQCDNGHITAGGEVEKRKAFVRTARPSSTFGAEPLDDSIVVFGSANVSVSAPFTYQRLQHPDGSTAMTSVVLSNQFGGNIWVAALFADGNTFEYYNGVLIADFHAGLAWSGSNTNANIALNLISLVNATDNYTATTVSSGVFYIYSTPNSSNASPYTIAVSVESNTGGVTPQLISLGIPSTAAILPSGQFQIIAGSSNTAASGTILNNNANPTNATTLTIGSKIYKFVSTFTGAINEILIQGTADGTSDALINAINNGTGEGVTYSTGTVKNVQVTASVRSTHTFTITAIVGGNVGNSLALTTTSSWTLSGATLSGGDVSDTNRISQIAVGSTNLLASYVQFNQSVILTASDLSAAINANTSASGYTATAVNGGITIYPKTGGASLNGTTITTTCAGNVCIDNCTFDITNLVTNSSNVSAIAVNSAASTNRQRATNVATITVVSHKFVVGDKITISGFSGGAAGYNGTNQTITAVTATTISYANTGSNEAITADTTGIIQTNLMTATITYQDGGHSSETVGAFVSRVVANINANSSNSGWLAYSDGVAVTMAVSKKIRISSDPIPNLFVTSNATITAVGSSPIIVNLSTTQLSTNANTGLSGSVTAQATGGTPPYIYLWQFVSTTRPSGVSALSALNGNGASTQFQKQGTGGTGQTESWRCAVSDTVPITRYSANVSITIN